MLKNKWRVGALGAVAVVTLGLQVPAAGAASFSTPADGFAGPLQFAVGSSGTLFVGQSFGGALTSVTTRSRTDLVTVEGGAVAGVAADGNGTLSYTASVGDEQGIVSAGLYRVRPNGRVSQLADLLAYETTNNPDQVNSYGFQGLSPECAAEVPPEIGGDPYNGGIDSNPYAVAIMRDGSRIVADAAGNDIIRVRPNGRVTTVAVLPPIPLEITAEIAEGVGLPICTVGSFYNFEPVPTDVEVGPDGLLYVSSLPGGPEGPELGARGSVVTVDPTTGAINKVADGFLTATNVAVAPDGTVYVAELFAGQISAFKGSNRWTVATLVEPAAVEYANGKLYASTNVFGNGAIVEVPLP